MRDLIKFGVLFIISSLVLSLFGVYLSNLFGLFNSTMTYITSGSVGIVLTQLFGYIGWFLDLLFLTDSNAYYTLITAPSVHVGSISWALTFIRLLMGATIFVLILSLIFGKKGD